MSFIPHHAQVTASGRDGSPDQWMLFLHGILGSGNNWRSFAQRLVDACPTWGAVLVDLRMHGLSQGAPAPHHLSTAAADLARLGRALPGPVRGVLGHSFGGKVALQYLSAHAEGLSHAFILDSMPGRRPFTGATELTLRVLEILRSIPLEVASRAQFVTALEQAGLERGVAQWLATNLERTSAGYRFRLSLESIDELMVDYFETDLWAVYETLPADVEVHVVLGGQSEVFLPDDRRRMASLAERRSNLHLNVLERAGHWLHVDDPEGLFQIVRSALERPGR